MAIIVQIQKTEKEKIICQNLMIFSYTRSDGTEVKGYYRSRTWF